MFDHLFSFGWFVPVLLFNLRCVPSWGMLRHNGTCNRFLRHSAAWSPAVQTAQLCLPVFQGQGCLCDSMKEWNKRHRQTFKLMQRQNDLTQSVALQRKNTLCYSLTMTDAHTRISGPLHPSLYVTALQWLMHTHGYLALFIHRKSSLLWMMSEK